MNHKQCLTKARDLLSDRAHWTQWVMARTPTGAPVSYNSPNAVCWCVIGALSKVADGDGLLAEECATIIRQDVRVGSLAGFNDMTNHETILHVLDNAIARTP